MSEQVRTPEKRSAEMLLNAKRLADQAAEMHELARICRLPADEQRLRQIAEELYEMAKRIEREARQGGE